MNPVAGSTSASTSYRYVPPAMPPVSAPLASGVTQPVDEVLLGGTGVSETSDYTQESIELARATPQQLAQKAQGGNPHAQAILDAQATARSLLGADGILL
jgi:hypothetical protein